MKTQTLSLLLAATVAFAACGNKDEHEIKAQPAPAEGTLRVAYVDIDSLQENYQYYLDKKVVLEQKLKTYQTSIQQKENALAQMEKNIQQRMQNGQINSQQQYESEVKKFQSQQQSYAQYRAQAEQDMAQEQAAFAEALQDSLDNFLAEYNKAKKYSLILNKATLLYGNEAMDITKEVTAGLNKRYKKQ